MFDIGNKLESFEYVVFASSHHVVKNDEDDNHMENAISESQHPIFKPTITP
jgi:hypothetical protein